MTRFARTARFAFALLFLIAARADVVDDYVKEQIAKLHIPGLSIAVVRGGKLIKTAGYGWANLETNSPATPNTIYKTASLSKQIIATAILVLSQKGKLELDADAASDLSGAPDSWKDITIRHLLTHTSGLVRDPSDYHPYKAQPPSEVIQSVYPLPLRFKPGEKWLYSDVGYYVLAQFITNVSGSIWSDFIRDRLFQPAGMTSTRTLTSSEVVPNRASGYDEVDGRTENAEDWIAVRPSGAFLSTVLDLAKWDVFLDLHNPLSAANWTQMRTPVALKDHTTADYGFGWYVDSFLGHARIHHDGQFPGFRSDYERFEDEKLSVIVLANSGTTGVESLAIKIAGYYSPELTTPPFVITAKEPGSSLTGHATPLEFAVKDDGNAAPESVVEMEIWDESQKTVYKQHIKRARTSAPVRPRLTASRGRPRKPGSIRSVSGSTARTGRRAMPGVRNC